VHPFFLHERRGKIQVLAKLFVVAIETYCLRRKMMLFTIFFATAIRLMWLLVDPFAFKGLWPSVVERLIFYSADGLIATCSNFVLLFWYAPS